MQCMYCNTNLNVEIDVFCPFCGSNIEENSNLNVIKDGKRKEKPLQSNITLEIAIQPIDILKMYHAYDLSVCLKLLRKKTSEVYKELVVLNNNSKKYDLSEVDNKRKEYRTWRKRTWIIENILLERQGFFPDRITNRYLQELLYQCQRSSNKVMEFTMRNKK